MNNVDVERKSYICVLGAKTTAVGIFSKQYKSASTQDDITFVFPQLMPIHFNKHLTLIQDPHNVVGNFGII